MAAVAQVLKHDPRMLRLREQKRARGWVPSDPESPGAPARKRRRVGEKQTRYAYVVHKFPVSTHPTRICLRYSLCVRARLTW